MSVGCHGCVDRFDVLLSSNMHFIVSMPHPQEARKGMGWGSNELVQFVTDPDAHELVISHRLGLHEPLLALRGALIGRTNMTHIHLEAVELNDEAVEVVSQGGCACGCCACCVAHADDGCTC